MIDGTAVTEIAQLAQAADAVQVLEIDGRRYTNEPVRLVEAPKAPEPAALSVHTLTGLCDYLEANRDGIDFSQYLLHVAAPGRVVLISKAEGEHFQRKRWIEAENLDRFDTVRGFAFGQYVSQEAMSIALQALFEDRNDRAAVLKVVGNVVAEEGITQKDDGVSQKVTVKAGISVVDTAAVPNPVTLAPFRTFPEVEQPESAFVFRLQQGGEKAVRFALFDADGGAWRWTAINRVAAWLGSRLQQTDGPDKLPIIA